MEYLQESTLKKYIRKSLKSKSFFYEEKCCTLIESLLRVVVYMHENYIAHRDIKPKNLFVQSCKAFI